MRKENKITHSTPFDEVVKRLQSSAVDFKVMVHKPLFTMDDVLGNLNIKPEQMGKTMLLTTEGNKLIAVLTPGTKKVDLAKVAKHLSVARNKIRISEKVEVENLGISIGSVSPFLSGISSVIVDESFLSQKMIYCGSGDLTRTICITVKDLVAVTSAQVVDVVKQ